MRYWRLYLKCAIVTIAKFHFTTRIGMILRKRTNNFCAITVADDGNTKEDFFFWTTLTTTFHFTLRFALMGWWTGWTAAENAQMIVPRMRFTLHVFGEIAFGLKTTNKTMRTLHFECRDWKERLLSTWNCNECTWKDACRNESGCVSSTLRVSCNGCRTDHIRSGRDLGENQNVLKWNEMKCQAKKVMGEKRK